MTVANILKIAISVLFGYVYSAAVWSAEISLAETGYLQRPLKGILIEGEIKKGDYDRFRYLVMLGMVGPGIWLASPGGDLVEAIRIGKLIRKLKLEVYAPDSNSKLWATTIHIKNPQNNVCASACFFIYAAGVRRAGDVLGVHRPRFTEENLRSMSIDEVATGQSASQEFASSYLKSMGTPSTIIEIMNSTKPSDMHWLTENELKPLKGYIPEYGDWLDAKCSWASIGSDYNEVCKDCSVDEILTRQRVHIQTKRAECRINLLEDEQRKVRSEVLDEFVKNKQILNMIEEQRRACSEITEKNIRECPKRKVQ